MKNLLISLALFVSLFSCANSQNKKLTADEIWGKYLQNFGNKEELMKIKTYSSSVASEFEKGEVFSKLRTKYPDKVFLEMLFPNNMTVTYIINGDSGIMKSPDGIKPLSEDEIHKQKQAALIFPELYYKDFGYKVELIGEENINNKNYYNLKITTESETINYIIDQINFEVFRVIDSEGTMEILKWIELDGIKVIEKTKNTREGEVWISTNIEQKYNVEINDSIFEIK